MQDNPLPTSRPGRTRRGMRGVLRDREGRLAVALRLALYVGALALAAIVASATASLARRSGAPAPVSGLVLGATYAGLTLLLTRALRHGVERRSDAGLAMAWRRRAVGELAVGLAVALAMLAAVAGAEWALGWRSVAGVGWDGAAAAAAARGVFLFSAVGFCEELVFRGAILASLAERWSMRVAVVASGVLFGLVHLVTVPLSVGLVVSAFAVTALLSASRLLTGSIWWAVGWHVGWDLGQEHLVGLASGGGGRGEALVRLAQGGPPRWVGDPGFPESGGLVIAAEAVAAIALLALLRRRGGVVVAPAGERPEPVVASAPGCGTLPPGSDPRSASNDRRRDAAREGSNA